MTAVLDTSPLDRADARQGWCDSWLGRPPSPLGAVSPAYEAGYAGELRQFLRDPTRCTPVSPRSWYGHDKVIRERVAAQLERDLGPDRFDPRRRSET